jgi:hypothetical protein
MLISPTDELVLQILELQVISSFGKRLSATALIHELHFLLLLKLKVVSSLKYLIIKVNPS